MQTIGKADNKMEFPLNWTDILLKSISGKTNYTIDVKIGTKRIATNQDLRDITKKRRKQSNPTRISSNEENTKNESDKKILFFNRNKSEPNNSEEVTDLKLTPIYPSVSLPLNLTVSENQKLSTNKVQEMHISNDTQLQNDSYIEISNNLSSSNQTFTNEIHYIDKKDNYSIESSTCMMPFTKNQPCTSGTNVGPTSVQIFNPEAFCDQCNKEFCNKYFLKTHKANKHGVFNDSHLNSSSMDQLERIIKISTIPTTCDFSSNVNDNYIRASTSSLFKSPVFSQSSTNTYLSKNMFNNQTRAFCSICQKEFCNKYFVRRHKAKIHGITDDGDYKINDDVPLNFKTNEQIKNEFLDFGVSDSCDKDVTAVPSSLHANESISEISKTHDKLFLKDAETSVDNEEELVMKYTTVETQHNNIKVEKTDDEQNVNFINKLNNELCNVNKIDSSELTSNSNHIINMHNEKSVFQNNFSKPNTKDINQQPIECKTNTNTPINLMTNNSVNGISTNNNIGKKINILNNYIPATITIVENENKIDKNIETDESKIELMSKSKLLTLHNLFFKFNGNSLENMSTCYVCNMQINGSLKTHIFNEHENIVHELMNETFESNDNVRIEHSCHECHQIFNSDTLLKEHVEQCECNIKGMGRASTSSKNSAETEEYINHHTKDLGEKKQTTMLSSFCKICNKELCNKYFMKTHMQRMHGISIQNGNHIGGVVCDVCNKELCSKYFLRVHKQNSHGIVENGSCQKSWTDSMTENGQLSDEPDNGHRYYKHYTEVCNLCLRRFRSSKWLSAHLLNDHGSEGKVQWKHIQNHMEEEKQNLQSNCESNTSLIATGSPKQISVEEQNIICDEMKQYRCSYCSFTTSILSFLFVHEKFHLTENKTTKDMPLTCPTCSVTFHNKTQLENHFTHCHFNSDAGNSPVSDAILHSPDNTHVILNANEDSSADKSLDNNGNDVFTDKFETSIKPQTKNVSPSMGNNHRIPESNHEPFIMQSFFLENCSVSPSVKKELSGRSDSFHSSLVYLPVKEKLTSTVNVFFKLTPT